MYIYNYIIIDYDWKPYIRILYSIYLDSHNNTRFISCQQRTLIM